MLNIYHVPLLAPLLLLLLLLLLGLFIDTTESVCLRPRVDLTSNDRGASRASQSDNGYKGFAQISGNVVARTRNGIFSLDPAVRRVGDHFGYDLDQLALADNGRVVATANDNGYVSVLRVEPNGTLTRVRRVADGIRDSYADRHASWGGLALNGNGTLLATTLLFWRAETEDQKHVAGLFPIDINDVVNWSAPSLQPVEIVPGVTEKTLVLSSMANVLVTADDACGKYQSVERGRMKIFRRYFNGTGVNWSKELDVWGHTHPCTTKWGLPGISVATNNDGSVVAIGAFNNKTNTPAVSVYQYQSNKAEWILRDLIETGNNRTFVSLSGDGNWLAIGTPLWNATIRNDTDRVALMHYDADKAEWETMTTVPGSDDNESLGNGIAINDDATLLAAGHFGTHLLVYDILHDDSQCQLGISLAPATHYPFPDTSACEGNAITINSSGPVLRLGLSGSILAFEETIGFDKEGDSTPKFYDLSEWDENITNAADQDTLMVASGFYPATFWNSNPIETENLTHSRHQDVALTANGTIAAILTQGDTLEDPSIIRVFRLNHPNHFSANGITNIFRQNEVGNGNDWAEELPNITSTANNMGSMAMNGEGTVLAVLMAQINEKNQPENVTVQTFALNDAVKEWEPIGSNISVSSVFTDFSLSRSGHILAVGDAQVGGNREGQVRIFEFNNNDWELQAEFNGVPDEDKTLGYSTTLNADGTILAVAGALSRDLYGIPEVGAVNVYHNTNETNGWELRDRFSVGNRYDGFGHMLSLSEDGRRMAVGSLLPYPERARVRLFVYDYNIGQWQLLFADMGYSLKALGEGNYDVTQFAFGASVALNEEGTIMAAGSAYRAPSRTYPEFVRVYNLSSCLANISMNSQFIVNRTKGTGSNISGDTNPDKQNISSTPTGNDSSGLNPAEISMGSAGSLILSWGAVVMAACVLL